MGRMDVKQPIPILCVGAPTDFLLDERSILEFGDRLGQKYSDLFSALCRNRVSGVLEVGPRFTGLSTVRQDDFMCEAGELIQDFDLALVVGFEEEACSWKESDSHQSAASLIV